MMICCAAYPTLGRCSTKSAIGGAGDFARYSSARLLTTSSRSVASFCQRCALFSSYGAVASRAMIAVRSAVLTIASSCQRIGSRFSVRGSSSASRRAASCVSRVSFVSFAGGWRSCARRPSSPLVATVENAATAARIAVSGLPFASARKASMVSGSFAFCRIAMPGVAHHAIGTEQHPDHVRGTDAIGGRNLSQQLIPFFNGTEFLVAELLEGGAEVRLEKRHGGAEVAGLLRPSACLCG